MSEKYISRKVLYTIIIVLVIIVCALALLLLFYPFGNSGGGNTVSMPSESYREQSIGIGAVSEPLSESHNNYSFPEISFDYSLPFEIYDESDISFVFDESSNSSYTDNSVSGEVSAKEESNVLEISVPAEVSEPEESKEVSQPAVSEPEFSEPEISEVEISEVETSVPEISIPEVSEVSEVSDEVSLPDESSTPAEETSKEETSTVKPSSAAVVFPTITVPEITTSAWNGTAASSFESGSGTKSDPYIIKTAAQLAYFRDSVNNGNNYLGKYIKLASDIKLNSGNLNKQNLTGNFNEWVGIGKTKAPFCGTFDGAGHVVSGIYGDALFGTIQGSVLNVGVTNSYINFCGGIIGTASKDYKSDAATVISNCFIVNSIVNGAGGIVDYAGGYDISGCYNGAYINAIGDWAGGVIGQLAFGTAEKCYNVGTVNGSTICGGVVGNAMRATFTNCYNVGKVSGSVFSGAFAGTQQSSTFKKCGYLSGTAEYLYQSYSGDAVSKVSGITKYTKSQIEY